MTTYDLDSGRGADWLQLTATESMAAELEIHSELARRYGGTLHEHPGHPDQKVHGRKGAGAAPATATAPEKAAPQASAWTPSTSMVNDAFTAHPSYKKWSALWQAQPHATPTDEESFAFDYYGGSGYMPINAALRAGKMPTGEGGRAVKAMDAYIERSPPLAVPVTVMRAGVFPKGMKPGQLFQDEGYVSTSGSRAVAGNFYRPPAMMSEIHVPAGAKVAPMVTATGGAATFEQELVLPRNTRLRFTGYRTDTVEIEKRSGINGPVRKVKQKQQVAVFEVEL